METSPEKIEEKENVPTKVSFTNEPKLLNIDLFKDRDAQVIELAPKLEAFIAGHERWAGKEVSVTFFKQGISSLVCKIESGGEAHVLKIGLLSAAHENEATFFKAWQEAGVPVPHIIEDGRINGRYYTLMDLIDAETISQLPEDQDGLIEKNTYGQMGEVLHKMHSVKGEGYGTVRNGKGGFEGFREWILNDNMQHKIRYSLTHGLLTTERHGSMQEAVDLLTEHIGTEESSYCHNDFYSYNIFDTEPLTVFDPNPSFNHGIIDLGLTLVIAVANQVKPAAFEQILSGYFNGAPYDPKVIRAAIMLNATRKFHHWHLKGRKAAIGYVQKYLEENK